ncbi:uncharacterized protein LOC120017038 isoform X1 [Tripterygium wilfordii]|uniref:uncharacterized protein LOC120017038 isoform X1 n=1 Tax=Tripterygium wilfordii TaxID=458696 RepID=UPI0018F8033B|nr:uncharacterized protein LOC120017038 isoform X1 [Tripterygium wilfordii]
MGIADDAIATSRKTQLEKGQEIEHESSSSSEEEDKQLKFEPTKTRDAAILAKHKEEGEAAKKAKRPFYLKKCNVTNLPLPLSLSLSLQIIVTTTITYATHENFPQRMHIANTSFSFQLLRAVFMHQKQLTCFFLCF